MSVDDMLHEDIDQELVDKVKKFFDEAVEQAKKHYARPEDMLEDMLKRKQVVIVFAEMIEKLHDEINSKPNDTQPVLHMPGHPDYVQPPPHPYESLHDQRKKMGILDCLNPKEG